MSERTRLLGQVLGSVVAALAVTLAVGFLEISAEAVERGLTVDWNANVEAVTSPGAPTLQRLAIACLCALYPYLRSPTIAGVPAALPAMSAAITLVVLSTWFFVSTDFPYSAMDTAVEEAESPITAWLRSGSLSTGIHVVTAALVVIAVMNAARSRGLGAGDESGGG
jgi:hypothetical protein